MLYKFVDQMYIDITERQHTKLWDIQEQKKRKRGYSSGCSYIDYN